MGWTRERSRSHLEDVGLAKIRQVRALKKRNKNSQPEPYHSGANAAADTLESEGVKTSPADAAENAEVAAGSPRGRSREDVLESPCVRGPSRCGFPVLITGGDSHGGQGER
jgi:hypothetical protein